MNERGHYGYSRNFHGRSHGAGMRGLRRDGSYDDGRHAVPLLGGRVITTPSEDLQRLATNFGNAKTALGAIVRRTDEEIAARFGSRQALFVYYQWQPFVQAWEAFDGEGFSLEAAQHLWDLAKRYNALRGIASALGFALSTPPDAFETIVPIWRS